MLLLVFMICPMVGFSQTADSMRLVQKTKLDPLSLPTIYMDGEELNWILLPSVHLYTQQIFSSPEARARYMRLRYNVMKVLPYAQFAQKRYQKLNRELALTGNKRTQKKLVKECETEIKEMFNKEIKNLTISQGKILVKLIDRETGHSSYEMVKELRGGVNAFFYQSIAKVFGHNLKAQYDPEEDREIEMILRSLPQQASIWAE